MVFVEQDDEEDMTNSPSMDKKKGGKRTKQPTIKGPWSKDEDDVVTRLVGQYGPKRWSLIASNLPGNVPFFLVMINHTEISPATTILMGLVDGPISSREDRKTV